MDRWTWPLIELLFVTKNKTRPDTRPQVANLSLRSLVVTDGPTHGRTDGQTKRFIESLIRD